MFIKPRVEEDLRKISCQSNNYFCIRSQLLMLFLHPFIEDILLCCILYLVEHLAFKPVWSNGMAGRWHSVADKPYFPQSKKFHTTGTWCPARWGIWNTFLLTTKVKSDYLSPWQLEPALVMMVSLVFLINKVFPTKFPEGQLVPVIMPWSKSEPQWIAAMSNKLKTDIYDTSGLFIVFNFNEKSKHCFGV